MIPLVGTREETQIMHDRIEAVAQDVLARRKMSINYSVGTMIEIPRAAMTRRRDCRTCGLLLFRYQRPDPDDLRFLPGTTREVLFPLYLEQNILHHDPFSSIDISGVGRLVATSR